MKVIFGGVRGSGPVSGPQFSDYGGDTTSVLVCGDQGERVVIDAGTGVRNLLPHLGAPDLPLVMLLTHYHLDHLMGLPAFSPLYQPERPLTIVGPVPPGGKPDTRDILKRFLDEPFWPIPLAKAGADLKTLDVSCRDGRWLDDPNRDFLCVGALEVRACPLTHPGGCVAWRIDEPSTGGSLVFATDVEWGRADDRQQGAFLDFCRNPGRLSLLVMDGHFTAAEYATHSGWGHSTLEEVAEIGVAARADRIAVTHHAPGNDDPALDARGERFRELVRENQSRALAIMARQGQELMLTQTDDPNHEENPA